MSALNMRSHWFFLVLITFWQMVHCSLQTKTYMKAVLWQKNRAVYCCKIQYVSKFTSVIARSSLYNSVYTNTFIRR